MPSQTPTAALDFGFKMLILGIVFALLPQSPFTAIIESIGEIPFLNYLCWFVPIGPIAVIFEAWLQVVIIYYGYMVVLRYSNGLKGS